MVWLGLHMFEITESQKGPQVSQESQCCEAICKPHETENSEASKLSSTKTVSDLWHSTKQASTASIIELFQKHSAGQSLSYYYTTLLPACKNCFLSGLFNISIHIHIHITYMVKNFARALLILSR